MRIAILAGIGILLLSALIAFLVASSGPLRGARISANPEYVWELFDGGWDSNGTARTLVTLQAPGNTYNLGVQRGYCWKIDGVIWKLLPGEIASVLCWRQDGGTEFGVFEEGDRTVIKTAQLSFDDVADQGHRGPFIQLFAL